MELVQTLMYALDKLVLLRKRQVAKVDALLNEILTPLFRDLEGIHKDYIQMFEEALMRTPFQWQANESDFDSKLHDVATVLQRLRVQFEPVREKIREASQALDEASLHEEAIRFVRAVQRYFPDGTVRPDPGNSGGDQTTAQALIQKIYSTLPTRSALEVRRLLEDTLRSQRAAWREVCESYTKLQLATIDQR